MSRVRQFRFASLADDMAWDEDGPVLYDTANTALSRVSLSTQGSRPSREEAKTG